MPRPWLLVVSGPPCSGKSLLARRLAADLGLLELAKDAFKESLFDHLGAGNDTWSRRLSQAAFDVQFVAADAAIGAGIDTLIEGNFRCEEHGGRIAGLAGARARLVQIACRADPDVLAARHRARSAGGLRHPGHLDATVAWSDADAARYAPLAIEPTLVHDSGADPAGAYARLLAELAAIGLGPRDRPAAGGSPASR
jgi:predicted kinase